MTTVTPAAELARSMRLMFETNPDLTLQMYAPARMGVFGTKATKSKIMGLYHLADGEVGYNTDEVRPLGALLKKALAELGYAKRIANAVALAVRRGEDVDVSLIIVAAGDPQAGETTVMDGQTDEEFTKGMPVMNYRIPRPVAAIIKIAASGECDVCHHTSAKPNTIWEGAPIPWADMALDGSVKRQIEGAVMMDMPALASIRKFGFPQTTA